MYSSLWLNVSIGLSPSGISAVSHCWLSAMNLSYFANCEARCFVSGSLDEIKSATSAFASVIETVFWLFVSMCRGSFF